jgi:hypothetical protein
MDGLLLKVVLPFALIISLLPAHTQRTENIDLSVIRQEKYKGCGSDFIGADMRVIYRLVNYTNRSIYVYGFSSDDLFLPAGYVIKFDQKTHEWQYPTGDNKPISWTDRSSMDKSTRRIEPGKSIEFGACHSTRETNNTFARTIYVSHDPEAEPGELISNPYIIMQLK